jgi:Mrp family chromosome partitioning ATPase
MQRQEEQQGANAQGGGEQERRLARNLERIRHRLLIMSGKGGVGKSSFAARLSLALARKGLRVGLVDIDLHGPSIAAILGVAGPLDLDAEQRIKPRAVNANLGVISMQSLLQQPDQAVIWRGPVKTGVIRQFIGEVQWGELDVMVIDAPPGTGDEPLSVAQSVPGARAVILTTPQEVALADVRKSIHFCRQVGLEILGLVENMGPFPCPCCGKPVAPFASGGGERTAEASGVAFLGTLPFDAGLRRACDAGHAAAEAQATGASPFDSALEAVIARLMARL